MGEYEGIRGKKYEEICEKCERIWGNYEELCMWKIWSNTNTWEIGRNMRNI